MITLICFVVIGKTNAQTDTSLNKFTGTWQWTTGSDTLTLILAKQIDTFPNNQVKEVLVGWHRYVKNGQLIESSFPYTNHQIGQEHIPVGNDLYITLYGFTKSWNKIRFVRMFDMTLKKKRLATFDLLPNSTSQAFWKLTNGHNSGSGPFTLPSDIIFTKQ